MSFFISHTVLREGGRLRRQRRREQQGDREGRRDREWKGAGGTRWQGREAEYKMGGGREGQGGGEGRLDREWEGEEGGTNVIL